MNTSHKKDPVHLEEYHLIEGMDALIKTLESEVNRSEEFSLFLNQKIVKIHCYEDAEYINVFDQLGNQYKAHAIIIAVPFSVLKNQKIKFLPEFSSQKQNAIQNFGISFYNAVLLEFENFFWNMTLDYVFPNGPKLSDWPQYLNGRTFTQGNKPILIAQFSGKKALFGNQTDSQIIEATLAPLKRVYGDNLPKLISYQISRFDSDPNILGGSLYPTRKNKPEDFVFLCEPHNACYFAGDYTEPQKIRRLEAAFTSGTRAALTVNAYLNYLNKPKKGSELKI